MRRPYERGPCGAVGVEFPKSGLNLPPAFSEADVGLRFDNPTYGFANDANVSRDGAKKWAPVTACV